MAYRSHASAERGAALIAECIRPMFGDAAVELDDVPDGWVIRSEVETERMSLRMTTHGGTELRTTLRTFRAAYEAQQE